MTPQQQFQACAEKQLGTLIAQVSDRTISLTDAAFQAAKLVDSIRQDARQSALDEAAQLEPEKGFENYYDSDIEIRAYEAGWGNYQDRVLTLKQKKPNNQ